jgi:c-di-GMP-binding flagellar brake protein YcgR
MKERRKHKRLPVIKDLAEPIELTVTDSHGTTQIPGVITNLSAGGMDLVLMGQIAGKPTFKLSIHLPGFDRFEVEGRLAWSRPREATCAVGIEFTKIDNDHARQVTHMADAFWECEDRIRVQAPQICFHGCTYWDLCEKPAKIKNLKKAPVI